MAWYSQWTAGDSSASALLVLAFVAMLGIGLGSIRIRGIGLGVAAVLFAGILAGHLGVRINPSIMQFARDAGLVLFVYSIGAQAGPGFLTSFRSAGLKLNALALLAVVVGYMVTLGAARLTGVSIDVMVGIYAGAVTNTPSLASAQQVLFETGTGAELAGLGYAVAYPGGVLGILGIMVISRLFLARPASELPGETLTEGDGGILGSLNIEVTEPEWVDRTLAEALAASGSGVAVSRHMSHGVIHAPDHESVLALGDVLLAVGPQVDLDTLCECIGRASSSDLRTRNSELSVHRIIVTRRRSHRPLRQVLGEMHGAVATRVVRGGLEFAPSPDFHLQYGDVVQVVGDEPGIRMAVDRLGNTVQQLDHPQLLPIALGILLGIILGSVPIWLPGLPVPLKLGLAGGPLIMALILSGIGRIGTMDWYLPQGASFMMRELGIAVFLACVGLKSGEHFAETLASGQGLVWVMCGLAITVIPLIVLCALVRVLRINPMTSSGLIAGSMTDPPALAFASAFGTPEKAYVAYAAVYPLVMIARVVSGQLLVIFGP